VARLEIAGSELVLRLSTLEQLGAFSREPRVPLTTVREVRITENPWKDVRGMRAPGAGWPGRLALGTWRRRKGKDFCAVYGRGPGVVVELEGARYGRFVVSADDPQGVVDAITAQS
jgi:hypothetical protein